MARYWKFILIPLMVLTLCSCKQREDDVYEPNNTPADATLLNPGTAIIARVNQGNDDVYKIKLAKATKVAIDFSSRGLEECPSFSVLAPDLSVLHKNSRRRCQHNLITEVTSPQVVFEKNKKSDYKIVIQAETPGHYYIVVHENHEADNIFHFSWDYKIVAK